VRRQLLAVGARHSLAPVLDIARDPRWDGWRRPTGRTPSWWAPWEPPTCGACRPATCPAGPGHGQALPCPRAIGGGRNHGPVQVGQRELREVYAEPFAAAIREAGLATVMSSYSCVDGLPGSGSAELLTDLLRGELGFDGMVVADYFAVALLAGYHRVAADRAEAAIRAITAGLDLELPALDCFGEPLKAALAAGRVPASAVDAPSAGCSSASCAWGCSSRRVSTPAASGRCSRIQPTCRWPGPPPPRPSSC